MGKIAILWLLWSGFVDCGTPYLCLETSCRPIRGRMNDPRKCIPCHVGLGAARRAVLVVPEEAVVLPDDVDVRPVAGRVALKGKQKEIMVH